MTWIYHDGGREAAGFRGETRDCVPRAIAIAAELPYRDVYNALHQLSRKCRARDSKLGGKSRPPRAGVSKSVIRRFLERLSWHWTATMFVGSGCVKHLRAEELPPGRLIVATSAHLVAVIDGVIYDTHDVTGRNALCLRLLVANAHREIKLVAFR